MAARPGEMDRTPQPFFDLWAVVALVLLTALVVFLPVVRESPVRVIIALGFVLFIPGYALIATLFPEQDQVPEDDTDVARGIDGLERVVFSFGASIAVVPLVALALNFTPWGITLVPVIISLGGLTLVLTVLAGVRRARVPVQERFTVSAPTFAGVRDELFNPADRTDAILNVVLVVSLLVAAASITFAIAAPIQGETFTELSLLTETDDGDFVAPDPPLNFTQDEEQPLVVSVTNQEDEQMNYTLVVSLQRVSIVDGDIRVEEMNEQYRYSPTLSDNKTWQQRHLIQPESAGEDLRLRYSLYRGSTTSPDDDGPYRRTQLWMNVSAPHSS